MKYLSLIMITATICFAIEVSAKDYYVNPKGNDSWSGTLKESNAKLTDGPFKTLERAKAAIRALKKANAFKDKVTVNIASGHYYLNQPLNFTLIDSGLPDKEILWQGEPGAKVIISGGMPISCKKRDASFWECPLSKLPSNTAYIDSLRIKGDMPKFDLFADDQKLELARWPDKDWAHIKLPLDKRSQFSVMEVLPDLTGDVKAAQAHIFPGNDWFDQIMGIESVNNSTNTIKLSEATRYDLASGRRFYIRNLPSLLNSPGEWLYEAKTKKIVFIPPLGIEPASCVLASLPNVLVGDGINYTTFKNLSFQHSAGTAILLNKANKVVLDHLDVNNIGGKGIEINGGLNVQLTNSEIHHTGSHGVAVSGGDKTTLQASGHLIHNNHIHNMGTTLLTYSPGIEVDGVGVTVTHNLLEQGPGTGILIKGNEQLIEKNELHHFCLQASDCGAVYTSRDWSWRGNVIRYNYIHDIIGYGMKSVDLTTNQVVYQSPDGARGVYLDDANSGFEVSGNIFENAGGISVQINGGRDNKIQNNYFKTNGSAIWIDKLWQAYPHWGLLQQRFNASPYQTALWRRRYPELVIPMHNKAWPEGNKIERNVIVSTKSVGSTFRYFVPKGSTTIANNIIWSTAGNLEVQYNVLELNSIRKATWAQWVDQGIEKGSHLVDPCVTISNKKMTTCPSSPIKDIGFKPLPTDIGLVQ